MSGSTERADVAAAAAPYYQDDAVTIYHGDAYELVQPGFSVRLITDPPYGTGAYEHDKALDTEALASWLEWLATAAIFGYPETLARICRMVNRDPSEWVTWWASNKPPVHFSKLLPRESEHVAIFGELFDTNGLTRPRSQDRTNRAIAASRGLDPEYARLGDVWVDPAPGVAFNHHLRQHPNEKPLSVMLKLVEICSAPGEVVLDPFSGSGTTLVAAKAAGRRAVGVEIDERHCETAALRCSQDVLPLADVS